MAPPLTRRNRIRVSFTDAECQQVEARADREAISLSDYVRNKVLEMRNHERQAQV